MRAIFLSIISLALVTISAAAPALVFESERVTVKAAPDQDQVSAEFKFTNTGKGEARVLSVLSGCQCLEAIAPPDGIAAGTKGSIRGIFKVGAFQGLVEKQMVARVRDDGGERDVVLTVAVEVPEVIKIEPNTLTWIVGQEPSVQSFTLRVIWPEAIHLRSVESSRDEFTLTIETIEEGKVYKVNAKPKDTKNPILGLVQFRTDCRFQKFRDPMAFVNIKPAP